MGVLIEAAFYCVSSRHFFLGAVGLINSIRLLGHTEPIFLLDCGLTPAQRDILRPHVALVPAETDTPPYLLKTVAPLMHPAGVMVLIDADMIVTRPLTELIEQASGGRIVAFENDLDRFVPEWGELLDLGPVRRQAYVSSGLVFMGGEGGEEVLRLMDDRQRRVSFDRSFFGSNFSVDYPLFLLDQDVLNAILATRVRADRIITLENRLAPNPPFRRLRLLDEAGLECAYRDGTEPYVIHQFVRKPWLQPMHHGIYSRLLARLLVGEDVLVRVPQNQIPLRMRNGFLPRVERIRVSGVHFLHRHLRVRLGQWIRAHMRASRPGSS